MSTPRTGKPNQPTVEEVDDRIPFPATTAPTACRSHPAWFSHEQVNTADEEKDVARAKAACAACPIVKGCLKWALANPDATRIGVWAATTPRQRDRLRQRLIARHGEDWVGAVTAKERERARRRQAARLNPPSVREKALAQLERKLSPSRHEATRLVLPAPVPPAQAAANRRALEQALKEAV